MNANDDRIDLSPLDPESDPDRLDRVVRGVLDRLGPGIVPDRPSFLDEVTLYLTRRAAAIGVAAALLVAISSGLLIVRGGASGAPAADDDRPMAATAPAALDVPPAWVAWLATGRAPDTEDLLFRTGGDR
jgi:hypothetical protein